MKAPMSSSGRTGLLFFGLCSCLLSCTSRGGFELLDDPPTGGGDAVGLSPDLEGLRVVAAYPTHGADWNDYVARDLALGVYQQADVTCDGSQTHWRECIHGGELRVVDIPGLASCTGKHLEETLAAFVWECLPTSGGIQFRTVGLAPGKGLRHLVHANGWLDDSVTVLDGSQVVASSPLEPWWHNVVEPLPDASTATVPIAGPGGTIYTVAGQVDGFGYQATEPRMAVVVLPGGLLQKIDNSDNCNRGDGTANLPDHRCLISSPAARFMWFEGDFGGIVLFGTTNLLNLVEARFVTVRGAAIENFYLSGLRLRGHANRILESTANENGVNGNGYGFDVVGDGNLMVHLRASRIGGNNHAGLLVDGDFNTVQDGIFVNNNDRCCASDGAVVGGYYNVVTRLLLANSKNNGLELLSGTRQNTFAFLTSINNGNEGIGISNGCNGNTFCNVLAANNTLEGIRIRTSSNANMTFANIASLDNLSYGLRVQGSDHRFTAHLLVGNNGVGGNADCFVEGGTTAGLIDASCADSKTEGATTFAGQASDATLWVNRTSATAIVGPISVDDTVNGDDVAGLGTYGAFDDWHGFESRYRGWGKATATFPGAGASGDCNEDAPACQIWDFRLRASDTALRGATGDPAAGTNSDPFVVGAACPAAAHGDRTLTDRMPTPNTFLLNAFEIILDNIGDEDGLCESDEACVYAPNFGVYQGEGPLVGPCSFVDGLSSGGGAVLRVSLFAYQDNSAN